MNKNFKKIVSYISLIILIILFFGGNKVFILIPEAGIKMNLIRVKGFRLVLIASIFYVYSIFTNKKSISYLSMIVAIGGYTYTFYSLCTILNADIESGNNLSSFVKYGLGFYLYIISFIILIINSILYFISNSNNNRGYKVQNGVNIDGQYILTNYIYGLKEKPGLSNKLVAIVSGENEKNMQLLISSEEVIKLNITYENLNNINIRKIIIISDTYKVIQNDENANKLLAIALLGSLGSVVVGSNLINTISDLNNYNKVKFNELYEIKINYILNGEPSEIMLKTKNNPKYFFEKFNDKLTIN